MNEKTEDPQITWVWLIPCFVILGWWIYDLQFQWSQLVEYQYGYIVCLLAAYLVWERWPTMPKEDRPAPLWICFGMALLGMPFVLVAELYKNSIASTPASSFALSIGSVFFLFANLLYIRGWKTLKHFAFPILFMFVAVPLPKILWNPIVLGLQQMVTFVNVEALNLLGIPAVAQVNVIQLPNCVVGIDEACSGIRSLQSSIMAAFFIGDMTLRGGGMKTLFVVAGIGLAVFGNFMRSLYLSLTAFRQGTEALEGVHDAAGWSILIFTAVGLGLLAWAIVRLEKYAAHAVALEMPKLDLKNG